MGVVDAFTPDRSKFSMLKMRDSVYSENHEIQEYYSLRNSSRTNTLHVSETSLLGRQDERKCVPAAPWSALIRHR